MTFVWQPKPKRCMLHYSEDSYFYGKPVVVASSWWVQCRAQGATSTIQEIPSKFRIVATLLENKYKILVQWSWGGTEQKVEPVFPDWTIWQLYCGSNQNYHASKRIWTATSCPKILCIIPLRHTGCVLGREFILIQINKYCQISYVEYPTHIVVMIQYDTCVSLCLW